MGGVFSSEAQDEPASGEEARGLLGNMERATAVATGVAVQRAVPVMEDDDSIRADPYEEDVDEETRMNMIDPFWYGTIGLTLTKFFDEIASAVYGIVSSFYTYDDLGLNNYQTAVMAYIEDIPGMFEIAILLFAVCVPIFGKRAKYYYILAKCTHMVVYVLLSFTSMSYYKLMFYGFCASWGSGLSGAVTDYLYVQRSQREPLHRQGYLAVTWSLVTATGSLLGLIFTDIVVDNQFGGMASAADWFTIHRSCFIYALYPLPLLPFYFLIYEPSVKPPLRRACNEMAKMERQVRDLDVAHVIGLYSLYKLMDISCVDSEMVKLDGCGMSTDVYTLNKIIVSVAQIGAHFYYRKYCLRMRLRNLWYYTMVSNFLLGVAALVPLYTWVGQNGDACSAYMTVYDIIKEIADTFGGNVIGLMFLATCHSNRGGLLYVLANTICDVTNKYTSGVTTWLADKYTATEDEFEDGDYSTYATLQLICLPFLLLPIVMSPLIPRTRKELQAFPERCRKGEVTTWVHFTDKYWPEFLERRGFKSASTLMLVWWAIGFCYTYWYSFDLLTWSSAGETAFMWAVVLPFLLVLIFSRCAGKCVVDEPGYGDDDDAAAAAPDKDVRTAKAPATRDVVSY